MLRILTVMDEFTREGLAIDVDLTTSAERVITVLTQLVAIHGTPDYLRSDNGMQPHDWFLDELELRDYRHTIEIVNSQCEKMGLERLFVRTNPGVELKVLASIIALSCTNMI